MPGPVYRADPARHRRHLTLDALDLIYHCPSGITHIVAEPVPQILAVLGQGPADVVEIVRRLASHHDIDVAQAAPVVDARMQELEAAGLVARA